MHRGWFQTSALHPSVSAHQFCWSKSYKCRSTRSVPFIFRPISLCRNLNYSQLTEIEVFHMVAFQILDEFLEACSDFLVSATKRSWVGAFRHQFFGCCKEIKESILSTPSLGKIISAKIADAVRRGRRCPSRTHGMKDALPGGTLTNYHVTNPILTYLIETFFELVTIMHGSNCCSPGQVCGRGCSNCRAFSGQMLSNSEIKRFCDEVRELFK